MRAVIFILTGRCIGFANEIIIVLIPLVCPHLYCAVWISISLLHILYFRLPIKLACILPQLEGGKLHEGLVIPSPRVYRFGNTRFSFRARPTISGIVKLSRYHNCLHQSTISFLKKRYNFEKKNSGLAFCSYSRLSSPHLSSYLALDYQFGPASYGYVTISNDGYKRLTRGTKDDILSGERIIRLPRQGDVRVIRYWHRTPGELPIRLPRQSGTLLASYTWQATHQVAT